MIAEVALPDTIRTKAFGSITNAFTTLGNPLAHTARIFRLINATDGGMFFSIDGTNNQFFLPANSFVLYDLTTNNERGGEKFVLEKGTQFYVKYSALPTLGAVYLEMIYGRGQ